VPAKMIGRMLTREQAVKLLDRIDRQQRSKKGD
jgi:hypothetical protein